MSANIAKNIMLLGLALLLPACSNSNNLLTGADEFLVISKPPLVLPPDYNMRPPSVNKALPIELDPTKQAQTIIFGENNGITASPGERLLVIAAGGDKIPASLRTMIDYEAASRVAKNSKFTKEILEKVGIMKGTETLDPQAEAARIKAITEVTGNNPVIIAPGDSRRKLPGT